LFSYVMDTSISNGTSIPFYCRCFWSGQSAAGGARTRAGQQCIDGVLRVWIRRRPWQVRTTADTAQRAAACQPLHRGIPLRVRYHLR